MQIKHCLQVKAFFSVITGNLLNKYWDSGCAPIPAYTRSKVDEFVPHTQHVNLRIVWHSSR